MAECTAVRANILDRTGADNVLVHVPTDLNVPADAASRKQWKLLAQWAKDAGHELQQIAFPAAAVHLLDHVTVVAMQHWLETSANDRRGGHTAVPGVLGVNYPDATSESTH